MIPQFDPRKIQEMLKKLGIKTEEVNTKEVIIKTDKGDIVLEKPEVMKIAMKDKVIYQIVTEGEVFNEEDIKIVMEQSGCKDIEKVKNVLKETKGDIVEAIIKLKES